MDAAFIDDILNALILSGLTVEEVSEQFEISVSEVNQIFTDYWLD